MRALAACFVLGAIVAPFDEARAQAAADARRRLPAAVQRAVDENKPGAPIRKLTVESEAGLRFYDLEFGDAQGEMDVAQDGTVLDVASVVELDDLPEHVAAIVRRAAAGTSIKQLTRSEVRARIEKIGGRPSVTRVSPPEFVYEAELARGGEVEIAADGRILKGPKSLGKPK